MTKIINSFLLSLILSTTAMAAEPACQNGPIYPVCADQYQLYRDAKAEAQAADRLVLIKFGYDACPWCRSLHGIFAAAQADGSLTAKGLQLLEIGVVDPNGKKVGSGYRTLARVAVNAVEAPKPALQYEAYPMLAMLDPNTESAVMIGTGSLEDNSDGRGHDEAKVWSAIEDAARRLRAATQ